VLSFAGLVVVGPMLVLGLLLAVLERAALPGSVAVPALIPCSFRPPAAVAARRAPIPFVPTHRHSLPRP